MVAIRLLVALVAESGGSATFRHFAVAAKLGGLASIEAEGNAAHPGGRTSPMVAGLLATWSPRACHGRSLKAEFGRLGQHQSRGALRGASGGARRPRRNPMPRNAPQRGAQSALGHGRLPATGRRKRRRRREARLLAKHRSRLDGD